MRMANTTNWDLFISHAREDKEALVSPLVEALTAFGLHVWYDDTELKVGDSLSRSIDNGLAKSNYGLVVLSPAFFAKRWPEYELRGLTAREMLGGKLVLPLWHEVTVEDVASYSPPLAEKVALRSSGSTIVTLAVKIIEVVNPGVFTQIHRRLAYLRAYAEAPLQSTNGRPLHESPIRHERLSPDLMSRIRLLRASLLDVHPDTYQGWVDGFRRDSHPSDEIQWWEHLASVYHEFLGLHARRLSRVQRQEAFDFLLKSFLPYPLSKREYKPRALTAAMVDELNRQYAADVPHEGRVVRKRRDPSLAIDSERSILIKVLPSEITDNERMPIDLPDELIRQLL